MKVVWLYSAITIKIYYDNMKQQSSSLEYDNFINSVKRK